MNLICMLISLPRPPKTLGCVPRVAQPSPLQSGQMIISYQWASRHLQSSLVWSVCSAPALGWEGKGMRRRGKRGDPGHWLSRCDVTQRVGGGETNIPFSALHPSARGWGSGNTNLSLARSQTSTPALVQESVYHPHSDTQPAIPIISGLLDPGLAHIVPEILKTTSYTVSLITWIQISAQAFPAMGTSAIIITGPQFLSL